MVNSELDHFRDMKLKSFTRIREQLKTALAEGTLVQIAKPKPIRLDAVDLPVEVIRSLFEHIGVERIVWHMLNTDFFPKSETV